MTPSTFLSTVKVIDAFWLLRADEIPRSGVYSQTKKYTYICHQHIEEKQWVLGRNY
jgi:hypothetical protein